MSQFLVLILANSPTSSPDFSRNNQQKFLTGMQSPQAANNSINQQAYQNSSILSPRGGGGTQGPPTTGLFDYLKNERSFQTPTKCFSPTQQAQGFNNVSQQQFNMNQSGFNQSRVMSPILSFPSNGDLDNSRQHHQISHTFNSTIPTVNGFHNENFWITIFGFPQNASSQILAHFSQCGSILEKFYSSGNWMHLKFSSKLECDKALLYNGKIINNNLMVGVLRCTDESIIDKENNVSQRPANVSRVRSLTQAAYKSAQEPSEVILSPNAPKRSTGIINKTLDIFFGW